jgi:hypothetical protein
MVLFGGLNLGRVPGFIFCILRFIKFSVATEKTTNTCTEMYHFFIQYTGSYMFRQWRVIIRELLGFV